MAGCKSSLSGEDFYGAYDAQETAKAHSTELGVDTVPSLNITYTEVRPIPLSPHLCRTPKSPAQTLNVHVMTH
jgi:ATP sulfurylase